MHTLVAPTINLLILLGIMAYYLRAPIRDFVASRHTRLRDELEAVRQLLKTSQDRFNELNRKLQGMDQELASLRDQARQDAQAIKTKLVEEARNQSTRISQDARSAAENLFTELKSQLYLELSGRVLDRAERLLRERLTGDDRARIRQEFSQQVERGQ